MQNSVPVALVYGETESSEGLRQALGEIGANLVCDLDVDSFSVDNLGASGAGVVLISLDAVIENRLDEIYGALDEDRYRVMFDDPEISNSLDGWEQARWQRHLAAKLRDIADWDPPRPEDAEPVEVAEKPAEPEPAQADQPEWMEDALSVLGESGGNAGRSDAPVSGDAAAAPDHAEPEPASNPADRTAPAPADPDEPPPEASIDRLEENEAAAPSANLTEQQAAEDSESGIGEADHAAAESSVPAEAEMDELAAQLDALADADDPLAALSALAGDSGDQASVEAAGNEKQAPAGGDDDHPADVTAAAPEDISATWQADHGEAGADAREAPDAPGTQASDADAEDPDWSALEAELNAAFDSDTMGAIDEASAGTQSTADADIEPATNMRQNVKPETESGQHSPAPAADSGETDADMSAAQPAEDAPLAEETDNPSATAAESEFVSGPELPDVSQWALIDDDPPADEAEDPHPGAAADAGDQEAAFEAATEPEPKPDEALAAQADEGGEEFELELVDPIDYLKPEAPPESASTELFNMPSLVPMAEAVAHRSGDDADEPRDKLSPVDRVVVLGASIGGPDAVREFLSHLPQQLPATVILVQHLGSEFVDLMVSQLAKSSALPVRIPGRAERAVHGEVLVVPSGSEIEVGTDGQLALKMVEGAAANDPSIGRTLTMAAEVFGAQATAVIFSGMAAGVASGATEISSRGGEVWVQDPESCVVSKMVDEVIEAGVARFIGTPEALAQKLVAHLEETDNATDQ